MIKFKEIFHSLNIFLIILFLASGCRSIDCDKENVEMLNGNLGNLINSPYDDFGPVIISSGVLLFTSNKFGIEGYIDQYSKYGEDQFWSRQFGGKWNKPEIFESGQPTTSKNEGVIIPLPNQDICFFSRSYDETGMGGTDIFSAEFDRNSLKVTNPEIVQNINSKFWDAQPALSPDGNVMIFVSDRPGGFGGTDLYITYKYNETWSVPKNLGIKFNSAGSEYSPSLICGKDTVLFFASDGRDDGNGALDIFYSFRNCTQPITSENGWFDVKNAGGQINSSANDAFPFADQTSGTIYFSSDRGGGCGGYDIFSQKLELEPPCLPLKGTIVDKSTGSLIQYPAKLLFKNRVTQEQIEVESQNGQYEFESFCRGEYNITVTAERYSLLSYNYSVSACEKEITHELESECFAIKGVVIDSSKSAVLGREIKILVPSTLAFRNLLTNETITASTSPPQSSYEIDKICPGTYEVIIRPENEERKIEDTYVGYWDKRYEMKIDFSNTNLVHELVPWEYEFVNDSIPFFVTGYYVPNVPASLKELREKKKQGNILESADYIRENEENADHYSVRVKEKFDTFIDYLNTNIFPLFIKSAEKNSLIEIKIEGYTDPRRIIPNFYYENSVSHNNTNPATGVSRSVSVKKRDPMDNKTLSILRAFYTMNYLDQRMSTLPLYSKLKSEGRINYIIDGKGIAPGASRDRPSDFPANRHVRIFVSQRRSK